VKVLSCFADESGYFNTYYKNSPYYIVTLLFHDQAIDITPNLNRFDESLSQLGVSDHAVHTAPLIRRESTYLNMRIEERKHIFNRLFNFTRTTNITYESFLVTKREIAGRIDLNAHLTKQMASFFREQMAYFQEFDKIIVYYDNGQIEVANILVSVFNAFFQNVEFRKVVPFDYRLFQSADLFCTLKLLEAKADNGELSKSEIAFFRSERRLRKNHLCLLKHKRFQG